MLRVAAKPSRPALRSAKASGCPTAAVACSATGSAPLRALCTRGPLGCGGTKCLPQPPCIPQEAAEAAWTRDARDLRRERGDARKRTGESCRLGSSLRLFLFQTPAFRRKFGAQRKRISIPRTSRGLMSRMAVSPTEQVALVTSQTVWSIPTWPSTGQREPLMRT